MLYIIRIAIGFLTFLVDGCIRLCGLFNKIDRLKNSLLFRCFRLLFFLFFCLLCYFRNLLLYIYCRVLFFGLFIKVLYLKFKIVYIKIISNLVLCLNFLMLNVKRVKRIMVFLMEIFILVYYNIMVRYYEVRLNIVENKQNSYVYIFNILFFKYIVMVIVQLARLPKMLIFLIFYWLFVFYWGIIMSFSVTYKDLMKIYMDFIYMCYRMAKGHSITHIDKINKKEITILEYYDKMCGGALVDQWARYSKVDDGYDMDVNLLLVLRKGFTKTHDRGIGFTEGKFEDVMLQDMEYINVLQARGEIQLTLSDVSYVDPRRLGLDGTDSDIFYEKASLDKKMQGEIFSRFGFNEREYFDMASIEKCYVVNNIILGTVSDGVNKNGSIILIDKFGSKKELNTLNRLVKDLDVFNSLVKGFVSDMFFFFNENKYYLKQSVSSIIDDKEMDFFLMDDNYKNRNKDY